MMRSIPVAIFTKNIFYSELLPLGAGRQAYGWAIVFHEHKALVISSTSIHTIAICFERTD